MRDGFKVFDADAHVVYPRGFWTQYLDEKFRHRVETQDPPGITHYNPVKVDGRYTQHTTTLYGHFCIEHNRRGLQPPCTHASFGPTSTDQCVASRISGGAPFWMKRWMIVSRCSGVTGRVTVIWTLFTTAHMSVSLSPRASHAGAPSPKMISIVLERL